MWHLSTIQMCSSMIEWFCFKIGVISIISNHYLYNISLFGMVAESLPVVIWDIDHQPGSHGQMGHEAGWPCAEFTKSRLALQFHAARRKTSCGHCGKKRCDWCSWLPEIHVQIPFRMLQKSSCLVHVQIQINQSVKNQLGTKPHRRWPKQRETKRTRKFHWRCWALCGCWETLILWSYNRKIGAEHDELVRYHFGSLCHRNPKLMCCTSNFIDVLWCSITIVWRTHLCPSRWKMEHLSTFARRLHSWPGIWRRECSPVHQWLDVILHNMQQRTTLISATNAEARGMLSFDEHCAVWVLRAFFFMRLLYSKIWHKKNSQRWHSF